jgi:hypothetical protein
MKRLGSRAAICAAVTACLAACSGEQTDSDQNGSGGSLSGGSSTGAAGAGTNTGGASLGGAGVGTGGALPMAGSGGRTGESAGGTSGGQAAGNSTGGTKSASGGGPSSEGLPNGSRAYENVVNLVNANAVAEVERLLRGEATPGLPSAAHDLYDYYLDEYDFLFIFVDHTVDNSVAVAAFEPVYRPARAATGDNRPTDRRLAHGSERLKGVIGGQVGTSVPPLEHELAHYWAAHLDPSFGFGQDREQKYESHWGMTGVYGQLGGFDQASMTCVTPAAAVPPNCTPESNGRFRYSFASFLPYVNRLVDYAPLELYLMGLLPAAQVPQRFVLLKDAAYSEAVADTATKRLTLEASGTSDILFSDILKVHGEVPLIPEKDRHYSAAFMVVSAAPASDSVMAAVAGWQEIFGNYAPADPILHSFESRTGGRATLTTRLGRRRTAADPKPMPPPPMMCSVTEQDCPTGLACYGSAARECSVPGTLAEGAACTVNTECLPGYACPNRIKTCARYCDPFDAAAAKACAKICANGLTQLVDSMNILVGAYCSP